MTTNTISSTPSSGGGKKSTSSTTAIATVKWDDQTANRFASLRTSLQHALIDSTLPLPAATTKKGADSPFSPTRPSATISAHYSRSHSESAALNSAAKVEMPSLRQNSGGGGKNYNSSLLPPSSNNNNSSAASSKQRTMISPSNNVTNGGVNAGVFPFARSKSSPLPPVVDNQQTKSNQNQLQQQPLLGRSISYSNNANNNDDNNIKIEEDDGLATMLATPPNNNHHYQYHVNAIRALLSDTPLPLAIITPSDSYTNSSNDDINDNANRSNNSSSNRMTILQPRQPKHNEHIYLLPRLYMRKWCDWTRNDVIVSCVDQWLSSSSSMMYRSNNGENTTAARAKVFELPHHAVQTLAALSVISDQYQFYSDDDSNNNTGTGNEEEWTKWWESVETCWMDWMTSVNERGWLLLSSTSDNNTTDGGILYDEKKDDGTTNHQTTEGMMHASQLFRDMFQMLHPTSCPPGAIDARMLIRQNKTLQLRRNVSLVMRGMNGTDTSGGNRNENVMTVQQEMDDEALINYIESSETDENAPHLAVNPVPSAFYEILRQTLGVLCEDNRTISYQPSTAVKNGGEQNGMSLLYHDQWKSDPPSPHNNAAKKNMDIHYPSSSTGGTMNNAANNPKSNSEQVARPIEFRRRFLLTSLGGGKSATKPGTTTSPSYASLLKEATQSMKESQIGSSKQETMNSVEVYPVEFHYSIIDGVSSPLPPAAVNTNSLRHCQQGMALASRASLAKNVLHDLERAASPGRSSACIRLWMKSRPYADVQAGIKGATKNGDGFDLIDLDSLVFSPPKKPKMPKSPPRSGRKSNDRPLTVGEWLKIGLTQPQRQKSQPVVVELLIEIRSSPTARWVRESLELENRLQVGDFVDAQDSARQWYEAIVREVAPDTVKVHYFGWGSKWDAILPRRRGAAEGKLKSKSPPVPLWSRTSRWREQIKVGDEVEVRESSSLVQRPKWHRATVLAVGRETDPPRELVGGAELEAMDDNGHGKKVPLLLLNRKRQILVEVPQERLKCTSPLPTVRSKNDDGFPAAQPPFIRWVNLYSEEICQVNTHQTREKKQTDAPATASYVMESKRELVEVMKPFNNIHGSGFVRESLRGNPIASGTVGLHNLGNSCYMNSILQCLNQIKPITNFFLQGEYLKEINKNNPLGSGGRISTAYASFLNDVWGNDYSILAPRLLKQTVGSFAPQFNNNFQHDSQEFCQFLMDGLHEDLNRVKNKPYVEQFEAYGMEDRLAAEESWRNHLKRHDSIFVDYTQGMHRSHLTCPGCGRESVKFDVYSSISLPLVPPKSGSTIPLKDCLDQFAAGEQLDEHNAWYCSNCKSHVCALKLITLWNTPDVLVLHLKRFTFEKCPDVDGRILRRKIEDTVNFPIDRLDLTEYVLGPIDPNAPPIYKLFGVSEHSGTTANTGHYTATVRNSEDGNWYRYNDSNVGFTSGDAAITGGAYLLFYQRIKGSLRWAGMEKELNGTPNVDEDGFQAVVGKKKKNRR